MSGRVYGSFFRLRFINGLQYRAAAYAGVATQFAWGFMEILLFHAFYQTDPAAFPMEFSQLAGGELLWAAVLQVFWLAMLILLGRLWMKRALRRVVIQGG